MCIKTIFNLSLFFTSTWTGEKRENLEVTSQGPGTALECALKLVELLFGAMKVGKSESSMIKGTPNDESNLKMML